MDSTQGPISGAKGQASGDSISSTDTSILTTDIGITPQAPDVPLGQAPSDSIPNKGQVATATPDNDGKQAPTEDTFFDPSAVPPELQGAYKQMQKAFTKKSQEISQHKQKVEAYDSFTRDPIGTLQQLATQYGYQIARPGDRASTQTAQGHQGDNMLDDPNWQPQTWGELGNVLKNQVMSEVQKMMGSVMSPIYQNVEQITSRHIEQQLSEIDQNWRIYEDDIKKNIQLAPGLLKSEDGIRKLYRMSVPDEIITGRATQAAVKKMEEKAQAAQTGIKTRTLQSAPASRKINNFDDAVRLAKEQLQRR